MNLSISTSLLFSFTAAAAAGCATQASSQYKGEPLVTLNGNVVSRTVVQLAHTAAVLDWDLSEGGPPPADYYNEVDVDGSFPSSFSLEVYTPPPANLIFDHFDDGNKLASATLYVVQLGDDGKPNATLGVDPIHTLVYLAQAVTADSKTGLAYGGVALTAGFHLIEERYAPTPASIAACEQEDVTVGGCTQEFAEYECTKRSNPLGPVVVDDSTPLSVEIGDLTCGQ